MRTKPKVLSSLAKSILRVFLSPIEEFLLKLILSGKGYFFSPVFIIGPPRSGTTLLYQILTQGFNFLYFTNIAGKFYYAPVLGLWLSKIIEIFFLRTPNYVSKYGKTKSLVGPHEAGEFWYRWFPQGEHVYVHPKATDERSLLQLRRQVMGISVMFQAPMLFKNTYNSMRIAPLFETFPDAVFLVCQRDPLDTAQSILDGRLRANGNKDTWWSVPPKEIDQIRFHPYWEQVVEQVYYIYQQIETDQRRIGSDRFLHVSYQQLCEDTDSVMKDIQEFFVSRNIKLVTKGNIPSQFPFSGGKKVNDNDYALLQQKVKELWKD